MIKEPHLKNNHSYLLLCQQWDSSGEEVCVKFWFVFLTAKVAVQQAIRSMCLFVCLSVLQLPRTYFTVHWLLIKHLSHNMQFYGISQIVKLKSTSKVQRKGTGTWADTIILQATTTQNFSHLKARFLPRLPPISSTLKLFSSNL